MRVDAALARKDEIEKLCGDPSRLIASTGSIAPISSTTP